MTQEATFPCETCGGQFPTREALESHMQREHEQAAEFRCNACGSAFSSEQALQEHAQKEHVR